MAVESIILDGQKLSGEDQYGLWTASGLEGWWDSPEPKGEEAGRESADGDFETPVYYEARYVTITGSLRSLNHEKQHQAMNRFAGLVQRKSRLQVSGHGSAQWADVVRASGLKMAPITDTYAQWQVRVKARDPRKYGELNRFTAASGVTVPVFHRGNYSAWPVFTITGDLPGGYGLWLGGRGYVVTRPLTSGSHVVNFRDGRLQVGGSYISGGVGAANINSVPPGTGSSFQLVPVSGSGTASINVFDTYI